MRIVLYATGGTGVGNAVRFARIGWCIRRWTDQRVVLITGVAEHEKVLGWSGVSVLHVPELVPLTRWGRERLGRSPTAVADAARAVKALLDDLAPDVFVTNRVEGVFGELLTLLAPLRASGCRVVVGWRDIFDATTDRRNRIVDGFQDAARAIDRVLVFGTPETAGSLPLDELPPHLRPVSFLGYIPPWPAIRFAASRHKRAELNRTVRVQVGGGWDGSNLLRNTVVAVERIARQECEHWKIELCTGLMSPDDYDGAFLGSELLEVSKQRWVSDFYRTGESGLVISMAGYNTCAELAHFRAPSILVPRRPELGAEQKQRAELFARWCPNVMACHSSDPLAIESAIRSTLRQVPRRDSHDIFARPDELLAALGCK